MDIERFTELADQLMERVPAPVLEGLNGGVSIRRNAMRDRRDPRDVYIMGEYVTDPALGCYVVIYYGSFRATLADEPDQVWEAELWETIRHELRHHLEARAGESGLDREDAEQVYELRKRAPRRG